MRANAPLCSVRLRTAARAEAGEKKGLIEKSTKKRQEREERNQPSLSSACQSLIPLFEASNVFPLPSRALPARPRQSGPSVLH